MSSNKRPHRFLWTIFGMFLGFALTIAVILGAMYYLFAYVNVEKVERTFGVNLDMVPSDLKTKTIKDLIPMASEATSLTVEDFCEKYDINISFKVQVGTNDLDEPIYIDFEEAFEPVLQSKIMQAFDKIDEVRDYFTISNTFALLGQANELPDFNFLHNPTYKDQPVQNMLSMLDDFTIGDFMDTSTDLATGIMSHIADLKIFSLSSDDGFHDAINGITIGEVLDIGADPKPVMNAIKDLTIGNLNDTNIINAIGELTLQEVLDIDDNVEGVMASLKDITINQIKNGEIEDEVKDLKLGEVIDITETSGVIYELRNVKIGDLTANYILNNITVATALNSNATTGVLGAVGSWYLKDLTNDNINNLKVGVVLNISNTATGILGAIKDLKIGDLNNETTVKNAIKVLKISDVLSLSDTNKIFNAIKNLKIEELTDAKIKNAISTLKVSDVIDATSTNKIWQIIANTQIGSVGTTIENLKLSDVVEYNKDSDTDGINDCYTGLLGYLIDPANNKDPKISELSTAIDSTMDDLVNNKTIANLVENGILDSSYSSATYYNKIENYSVADLIEMVLDGTITNVYIP